MGVLSCGGPYVDLVPEATDAFGELSDNSGGVASDEVICSEVLVISAVLEHVIGGGQDRGGDCDRSFLRPRARLEAQELSMEVAVLCARCGPGALDEHGLEPGRALAQAGASPLAGALVETRHEPGPG